MVGAEEMGLLVVRSPLVELRRVEKSVGVILGLTGQKVLTLQLDFVNHVFERVHAVVSASVAVDVAAELDHEGVETLAHL